MFGAEAMTMIEYLFANARRHELEATVRKSEWLRWWPVEPETSRDRRGV